MSHTVSVHNRSRRKVTVAISAVVAVAVAVGVVLYARSADHNRSLPVHLPIAPQSYLGVYLNSFPRTYSGMTTFAQATGTEPDIAMYYSGWYVPFPTRFATTAADNGVVPLVQMDPTGISLSAIASGKYAAYLGEYAEAVKRYGHPVILSFGHEMNGDWYNWGYKHASPQTFVAAWRYIVKLFRGFGAKNVTWLWTVNIIDDTQSGRIPSPKAWWPGASYVNWVGIDGYYRKPSWQFAPLFGPTIAAVHELTSDPILIAETGAVPAAGQPKKITDLFAGIHDYGLLGFVWFDGTDNKGHQFGLSTGAALAAFRKGARTFRKPGA